jgi:hypothetical protein
MIILSNFIGYNYIFVSYLMFIILINVMLYFKLNFEWSFFPCLPGLKFPVSRSEYYQILSTMWWCGKWNWTDGQLFSFFRGEVLPLIETKPEGGLYLVTKINLFFYKSDDLSSCLDPCFEDLAYPCCGIETAIRERWGIQTRCSLEWLFPLIEGFVSLWPGLIIFCFWSFTSVISSPF